jgi:hypothetical protein
MVTAYGSDVMYDLIVQAAMDTGIQGDALIDILNYVFGTNYGVFVIYDKRFNDQLDYR